MEFQSLVHFLDGSSLTWRPVLLQFWLGNGFFERDRLHLDHPPQYRFKLVFIVKSFVGHRRILVPLLITGENQLWIIPALLCHQFNLYLPQTETLKLQT